MGVLRIVFNAIAGPLLVLILLMSHVTYHTFLQDANTQGVKVVEFPKENRETLLAKRKVIMNEVKEAVKNLDSKMFLKHITSDFVFEDPIERFVTSEEMGQFLDVSRRLTSKMEVTLHQEHHGIHESVIDWTLTFSLKMFPNHPWVQPMRTHFLFGSGEQSTKMYRGYEEWNGHALLSPETTQPSILGKVHVSLRRFIGYLVATAGRKGWM